MIGTYVSVSYILGHGTQSFSVLDCALTFRRPASSWVAASALAGDL